MAGQAPVPFVECGQFVCYENKTCLVTAVEPNLGFNRYSLLDIDTGKTISAHRFQLERVAVMDLDLNTNIEMDAGIDFQESSTNESTLEEQGKRFLQLTDKDLDMLSAERNCKNTIQQTKWGINVLRGRSSFVYS